MLGCAEGCGCGAHLPSGMGGFFSTILNVAGSVVGDPQLGNQIASQAAPGFAPISQNAQQIADKVSPQVMAALQAPVDPSKIPAAAQQVAAAAAPAIAQALAAQGYLFPAGTLGASYQKPSIFDAFGGQYKSIAEIGFAGLGALLLFKLLKG